MNARWTNEEINFLRDNYHTMSIDDIAKTLGRSRGSIKTKACKLDFSNNDSVWTNDEIEFLKTNYKYYTNDEIGEMLGRTTVSINIKASRIGLSKNRHNYNRSYFNVIDTEDKAYWLGFFYADGCIHHKHQSYECSVCLKEDDILHLEKFNHCINGNIRPFVIDKPTAYKSDHKSCCIRLYSKEMYEALASHGCVQNKSLIKDKPINLPLELIRHFIRGYYDGNGSLSTDSNDRRTIGVNFCTGSEKFAVFLNGTLRNNNVKSYIFHEKSNTYRVHIKGLYNTDLFFNFIYNNSTIYLDRKFIKKNLLYDKYNVAQRLLRQLAMTG